MPMNSQNHRFWVQHWFWSTSETMLKTIKLILPTFNTSNMFYTFPKARLNRFLRENKILSAASGTSKNRKFSWIYANFSRYPNSTVLREVIYIFPKRGYKRFSALNTLKHLFKNFLKAFSYLVVQNFNFAFLYWSKSHYGTCLWTMILGAIFQKCRLGSKHVFYRRVMAQTSSKCC